MEITELELYAKKYPNISIEQLIENIKKESDKTPEEDAIRKENEKKWFEDLIGKYIRIDFPSSHFSLVFHCNESLLGSFYHVKVVGFNFYRTSEGFELAKDEKAINYLWFNCPYTNRIVPEDTKMEIITEEKYNQLVEIYNAMDSQLKEWLLTK